MQRRKRIDPRVIGSFVVGAIILSVAGLIFFGPGGFLTETKSYVIFFDGSVKGLNVGSPVRFRGVKIGQIKEINVTVRPNDYKFYIPVVIEIEPSRIKIGGSKKNFYDSLKTSFGDDDPMLPLIDKGLRAQMQLDSLVTGQLYVNLDMLPKTPVRLTGYESDIPELPAVTSSLEELTKTLQNIPLKELADKLISSAEGFEKLVTSPSLHNGLAKFDNTMSQLNKFLETANAELLPVINQLKETINDGQLAIRDARKTIDHIDTKVSPLSEKFAAAAQSVDRAAKKTSAAMQKFDNLADGDSPTMQKLGTTLQEIHETARALRYLTSELERDPQMLLRGRAAGGKK